MSAYNDGCHQSPVSARADECERKSGVRPSSSIWGEGVAQVDEDRIRITGFAPARQLLRWEGLRQAGFKAALLERIRSRARIAVLFQEGEIHQAQRIATARFFAPRVVDTRYRALMTTLSLRVSQLRPGPRLQLPAVRLRSGRRPTSRSDQFGDRASKRQCQTPRQLQLVEPN